MRFLNRVLGALLALTLITAGVLVIVEVIAQSVNGQPALVHWHSALDWANRTTWNSGGVRVGAILIALFGCVLLVAELKPSRPSRFRAQPGAAEHAAIDTAYTRRGLAATVRDAVTSVDGVRSASVKVKRRSVRVTAKTSTSDRGVAGALRAPVTAAADDRLHDLLLVSTPRVLVRVIPRRR